MDEIKDTATDRGAMALLAPSFGVDELDTGYTVEQLNEIWSRMARTLWHNPPRLEAIETRLGNLLSGLEQTAPEAQPVIRALALVHLCAEFISESDDPVGMFAGREKP